MIDDVLYVIKSTLRPHMVSFFVIVLGVGVILSLSRRRSRLAQWYFAVFFLGYWIVSTPACAERLVKWSAHGYHPLVRAEEARGARTVVVLGAGGSTYQAGGMTLRVISSEAALRLMEGARLYRLLGRPTVIVSGGVTSRELGARPESEAMRDAIIQLGVPQDHVLLESESKTTHDEAVIIRRMLADRVDQPIVLVTSPSHMRRSVAVFLAEGLDPVPSTCAYKSEHADESFRWLPHQGGLSLFDTVLYDTVAELYYRVRGWTPRSSVVSTRSTAASNTLTKPTTSAWTSSSSAPVRNSARRGPMTLCVARSPRIVAPRRMIRRRPETPSEGPER